MLTLQLPFPPSTNNLFLNAKRKGRVITKAYEGWRDVAGWNLKAQLPERMIGPVWVHITLHSPDNRIRDVDNYIKAPLDLLVEHQVIEADNKDVVRRITCQWEDDGPKGQCLVTIEEAQ